LLGLHAIRHHSENIGNRTRCCTGQPLMHAKSLLLGHSARCIGSEPMRTWAHERLLSRSQRKDSLRCRRRRHVQGSGCSHLLREPLLDQTLRQQGQKGRIAGSEEEARIYSEARREGNKAPCRRSRRTALPHTPGALRLHRGHDGALCKSLHHVPRHSQDRSYQEKGGRVATERDEFERAAWRVMMAAVVKKPERLIFVDECGTHTSLGPLYGYAPRGQRLYLCRCRETGARTRRCFRA
jgi:hypothetical protein